MSILRSEDISVVFGLELCGDELVFIYDGMSLNDFLAQF